MRRCMTGGQFCALRKADAETMYRVIARDRLTWTLLLPGVLTDFLNHPQPGRYDLTSLRFAIGYANMMPDIVAELTADFCDRFLRRVRPERILISACPWRFRSRRDAELAQAAVAADGGAHRR